MPINLKNDKNAYEDMKCLPMLSLTIITTAKHRYLSVKKARSNILGLYLTAPNTRLKIALNVQCMNLVSMIKVSRLDVIHPAGPSVFQALFFLQEVPLKVNS